MKTLLRRILLPTLVLAFAACRPDQVEHLKDSKRIGIEAENWEVKRIMPKDLLRATRWAGDSLTATADTLLRRTLARELAAGGVAIRPAIVDVLGETALIRLAQWGAARDEANADGAAGASESVAIEDNQELNDEAA